MKLDQFQTTLETHIHEQHCASYHSKQRGESRSNEHVSDKTHNLYETEKAWLSFARELVCL